jgi:hypothetical protein
VPVFGSIKAKESFMSTEPDETCLVLKDGIYLNRLVSFKWMVLVEVRNLAIQ